MKQAPMLVALIIAFVVNSSLQAELILSAEFNTSTRVNATQVISDTPYTLAAGITLSSFTQNSLGTFAIYSDNGN